MSLKLIIESPEKIRLFDPDRQNILTMYLLPPLVILLIFSPVLYFFGIFHPSYQIYCEKKTASFATGCVLKSTYYFIIPWYTHLGTVNSARFQINPNVRRKKVSNSCGNIVLLTSIPTNPLSYANENQKKISFYLNCGNFDDLQVIVSGINQYLTAMDVKKFNLPSLPTSLDQYLWIIGIMAASLFFSKQIEVIFDKKSELVIVKTKWVISWIQTYPLSDVKKIVRYETKDNAQHLIMNLIFSRVDLGDVSELDISEQKQICRSINDFLSFK